MKSQGGFSLIEVLIVMVILGAAFNYSTSSSDLMGSTYANSKHMVQAQTIAVAEIEELLSIFSSDIKLQAGVHTQGFDDNGLKVSGPGAGIYTATWTVSIDTPITKIIQIDLAVSWNDNGHTRAVHILTFRMS